MIQTHSEKSPTTRKKTQLRPDGDCCEATRVHPDHSSTLGRLRRIQGQLVGIERMIMDRRYCAEILVQCRAAGSALKAFEGVVLETHVRDCVRTAIESKNKKDSEKKISELMDLFLRN